MPWQQWFCCSSAAHPGQVRGILGVKIKLNPSCPSCPVLHPRIRGALAGEGQGLCQPNPSCFSHHRKVSSDPGAAHVPQTRDEPAWTGSSWLWLCFITLFISVHPGVLTCFPCCTCCTQSFHIWAQGIFLLFPGLALPPSCIPARGFFVCSTPKPHPCRGGLTWAGGGLQGGPRSPSQVMSCCFQVAEHLHTDRLLSLRAFDECFPWFCWELLFPGSSPRLWRRSFPTLPTDPRVHKAFSSREGTFLIFILAAGLQGRKGTAGSVALSVCPTSSSPAP